MHAPVNLCSVGHEYSRTHMRGRAGSHHLPFRACPRSAPRAELNVSFRPGASTWNTDEPAPSAPSTSGQAGQVREHVPGWAEREGA